MTRRNVIRLTESDLHRIIRETLDIILSEGKYTVDLVNLVSSINLPNGIYFTVARIKETQEGVKMLVRGPKWHNNSEDMGMLLQRKLEAKIRNITEFDTVTVEPRDTNFIVTIGNPRDVMF